MFWIVLAFMCGSLFGMGILSLFCSTRAKRKEAVLQNTLKLYKEANFKITAELAKMRMEPLDPNSKLVDHIKRKLELNEHIREWYRKEGIDPDYENYSKGKINAYRDLLVQLTGSY